MTDRRAVAASRRRVLPAAALLAGFLGCVGPDPDEPPAVRYGVDACDRCRMIVSDERFAAARWLPNDVAFARYDDIGCLLADLRASARWDRGEKEARTGGVWVHDHDSGQWIDARDATYVRAEDLETPMNSHLAAFATTKAARAFSSRALSSRVLGWAELGELLGS